MNHKLLIIKLNFNPALRRRQDLSVLLSKNYQFPSAKSSIKLQRIFQKSLELGKVFLETPDAKYYFANITSDQTPEDYSFHKISTLSEATTPEYQIILQAIKILGYEI